MTVELPSAVMLSLGGAALVAVTGWVARVTVLDRIKALEASVKGQGERFGNDVKAIEGWQKAHDAVENYIHKRRNTLAGGVPIHDE